MIHAFSNHLISSILESEYNYPYPLFHFLNCLNIISGNLYKNHII